MFALFESAKSESAFMLTVKAEPEYTQGIVMMILTSLITAFCVTKHVRFQFKEKHYSAKSMNQREARPTKKRAGHSDLGGFSGDSEGSDYEKQKQDFLVRFDAYVFWIPMTRKQVVAGIM